MVGRAKRDANGLAVALALEDIGVRFGAYGLVFRAHDFRPSDREICWVYAVYYPNTGKEHGK